MSNKQARAAEKLVLTAITITLDSGKQLGLDITKVDIIDKKSKKRLFKPETKQ